MLPPKSGVIDPAQDAARLTTFGKKLRSTSLDELPELFNIRKGDMSVIGPRPLLVQYLSRLMRIRHAGMKRVLVLRDLHRFMEEMQFHGRISSTGMSNM